MEGHLIQTNHKLPTISKLVRDVTGRHYNAGNSDVSHPRPTRGKGWRRLKFRLVWTLSRLSQAFKCCKKPSLIFGGPHELPSWIWMLIRPWGRVCYNPWCNVLRMALVFNGHHWTKFEGQFEDVWKPQNLDLLALQEMVSIKNHKASGLRLKMVFWLNCRIPCHSKTHLDSVAMWLRSYTARMLSG